ncbi:MAG TPA: FAD-dependent monooxygenase [Nocardioidaceae bacterium]|nr:FAD-dependent monooxygenase [Nocardioidaceae bacterium]
MSTATSEGFDPVRLPPYTGDPVVIVGNGPVGQTLALLLARWGVGSVLLDRRPRRDLVGSRAICQQRDVLDVWDSVGVGRTVAAEGVTWERARTFYREHELFCLQFRDRGRSAFPPFVNISQGRTEELLDEQIAKADLVDVRWGHTVTDVRDGPDGVEVEVEAVDGRQVLRAPYAALCTGGHSARLRENLGVEFGGRSFDDHFLICDIRAELPGWENERRFYFDPAWNPGRQVLIHPCPDSTYRIDWQVPQEFDLGEEERRGALDARIRRIIGDTDYEIVWKSVYRFHSRCVSRMRTGHVLLAGDSAHLMAPFGARGLNSGVGDAENAAWKLAFVLRGWADDRLLDSYDAERLAAARENLAVTTATMDFLVPQSEQAWQHRRTTLERAVGNPEAPTMVDSGRLSEPFWYVDSPLTTADPTREPATRPPRGEVPPPGVGVLVPDGPVVYPDTGETTRLRRLCRHGATVLVAAEQGQPAVAAEDLRNAVAAPVRVCTMTDLSPDGALADALGARPGEAWVVRPDAFVAAIVRARDTSSLRAAVQRAVAPA